MADEPIVIALPDAAATQALGRRLGTVLSVGSVILLEGDLGAGKTTLVQGMGEGLQIHSAILSPTFTLINEYLEGRIPLYHLDLYRLQPQEIAELSPEIYWEGQEVPPGITAIEWATRLPYRPASYLDLQLLFNERGRQAIARCFGDFRLDAHFWTQFTGEF